MATLLLLCASILCVTQAQYLPLSAQIPPCQQVVSPCQQLVSPCQPVATTSPVVATTIIDNSVSNSLANALQLLIVSNLIENSMNSPCGCGALSNVAPFCDCASPIYPSAIEVFSPPILPFDPIPPCELIAPCEPLIEVIPNACYPEILPVSNPVCGCGCDGPYGTNYGPFGPNFGYDCGCGNILQSLLPSLLPKIGLPNFGCGCRGPLGSFGPFGSCGCDQCGPIIPDIYPNSCGCGGPYPVAVNYDPRAYDPYPNRCYGNNPYYY